MLNEQKIIKNVARMSPVYSRFSVLLKSFLCLCICMVNAAKADECAIVYGVYADYKPLEWVENGKPYGINVELIKAVAAQAGCKVTLVSHPWPQMLAMLNKDEITILSASLTPERVEHYIQLPPAFVTYRIFVGRKGAALINSMDELDGKTVFVLNGSVAHENLIQANPNVNVRAYPSEVEALKALSLGEGDLALIDDIANLMRDNGFENLIAVSNPLFPTLYGFMLKQGSPYFYRLSQAADRLKETGEYYKIINAAKDYRYSSLLKTFTMLFVFGGVVLLLSVIFLWNKALRFSVRQKTHFLNQEIERRISTENALLVKKQEYQDIATVLQTILQRAPVLVLILDKEGAVLWKNRKEASEFSSVDIKERIAALEQNAGSAEFSLVDNNEIPWKVLALAFRYENQDAVLLFVDDITENIRLRDELFMTSRYSALGEMAAVVAHEINNPIGSILHNFDFLQQYIPEMQDKELTQDIEQARSAVLNALNRMKSIVDELRGYSTRQTRQYDTVDLCESVRSAVGITRFLINRHSNNFYLNLDYVAMVYGNYGQIEQMVINVLQNACYALTEKSQAIGCAVEPFFSKEENKQYMLIRIFDEGEGMSEAVLKNVCNPYFSTRKETGGTGLGLSLTSRLIKEHGGYMKIESVPGQGTTVTLYFPAL